MLTRRPQEEWLEFMGRLERERLRVRGEQEATEAKALQAIGDEQADVELKVAASAKRAAAEEFFRAVEDMERGAG